MIIYTFSSFPECGRIQSAFKSQGSHMSQNGGLIYACLCVCVYMCVYMHTYICIHTQFTLKECSLEQKWPLKTGKKRKRRKRKGRKCQLSRSPLPARPAGEAVDLRVSGANWAGVCGGW